MDERIGFALFFGIFIIVYYFLNRFVLSHYFRLFGIDKGLWFHVLVVIGALSYVIAAGLEALSDTVVFRIIYVIAAVWMGILFMLFCVLLIYLVISKFVSLNTLLAGAIMVSIVLLATIYSIINAYTFNLKEVNLYTGKDVSARVVQVSDLHLGPINGKGYLERVVKHINAAHPDIVLITGDLLDGRYHYEKDVLLPLNDLDAQVYFSSGNHDDYANLTVVGDLLKGTKVKWLRNRLVEHEGLYIIGLDDTRDSKNVGAMLYALNMEHNLSKRYTILMNHRPIGWKDAGRYVDLMLSGHTHAGQLWPFTYMVLLEGNILHGIHKIPGNSQFTLYVSPGTGTWGPPMRSGSRTEITVFNIRHANK